MADDVTIIEEALEGGADVPPILQPPADATFAPAESADEEAARKLADTVSATSATSDEILAALQALRGDMEQMIAQLRADIDSIAQAREGIKTAASQLLSGEFGGMMIPKVGESVDRFIERIKSGEGPIGAHPDFDISIWRSSGDEAKAREKYPANFGGPGW